MGSSVVTKDQLLAKLAASARPVTPRKLERWYKAGHMDRPERRHLPGVRGSVSVFPARAFELAAALYDAAQPARPDAIGDRRLDERAFLLWWSGKPIVHDVRQLLLRLARGMLDAVERMRAYQPTQIVGPDFRDGEDAAFDTADAYFYEHPPEGLKGKLFKAIFANLARKGVDLQSVMIAMFTAALGGMMTFEGSHDKDEPSLAVLVLKAFGFSQFPSDTAPEDQVVGITQTVSFFANRAQVMAFTQTLSDEELDIARKCARAMFEGLPEIFEMQAICFGKRATARILRAFSSMATAHFKATSIIAMAWLLRREGTAHALRLVSQIEEALPKAQAMSKLAKAFPQYRKELLTKNADRLAALPEETKRQMLAILKPAIT
jgi:hypothetical protein